MATYKAAMHSLEAGDARPLGLEEFRHKRGLSLERIAEITKLSTRFLRAIENGQYSVLPGGIFNTSYLRQYAAAVGYEQDVLLDHYRASTGPAPPDDIPPEPRGRAGGWFSWIASSS